jgi:hypothetical protein
VPSTHTLVFYYTSQRGAKQAMKSGIQTNALYEGIPFTLRSPHRTSRGDFEVFNDPEKKKFPLRNKYTKQSSQDTGDILTGRGGNRKEFPHEHVLVVSLPKKFLCPLPGYEEDPSLRLLPAEVLTALRPTRFDGVYDQSPWLDKKTLLPPTSILRSFWIYDKNTKASSMRQEEDDETESSSSSGVSRTFIRAMSSFRMSTVGSMKEKVMDEGKKEKGEGKDGKEEGKEEDEKSGKLALKDKAFKHKIDSVTKIELVSEYVQDMKFIRNQAARSSLVPLYHYTSRHVAHMIIEGGIRMLKEEGEEDTGSGGGGGGGSGGNKSMRGAVHMTTKSPASYQIGTYEYEVNIIKDCLGPERVKEYSGKGKFDVIIVYGCAPVVFEKVVY